MVENVFDRTDLDQEKLVKLIREIQHKLAFIEKRGGYNEAYAQMKRQLDFLMIEMKGRIDKDISDQVFNEKPFTVVGDEPESK
jgi:hypothetical protein